MSTNENARRQPGAGDTGAISNKPDYETIKAALQSGRDVRVIDFPPEDRPALIGILASLRDALPIRCTWQTIREKHASETRLRARRYWLPGEFITGGDDV